MAYRKKIQTGIFLFLACIVAAQGQSNKTVADKIVAIVGDRIILYSDIINSIKDAERREISLLPGAQCIMTEQAVIAKVLMLQAEKDSLPVTDEEVEAQLDEQIAYFIRKFGSRQELERVANRTTYQIKEDARESVKERKLSEEMRQKIIGSVKITPAEVKAFFDRISVDSLPLFESELEVGQVVIYPKASRELELYIVAEMNNYKKQVESKSVTFEQIARAVSEDQDSRERGGDYEINRNEKTWGSVFLSTAFRLKNGEISAPVKVNKSGYFLIQMVEHNGDNAHIRLILRIPPVTGTEIDQAKSKLDSARLKIIAGTMAFNEVVSKYSDEDVKGNGPFITNREGSAHVTIDALDKDMVVMLSKMKVGDFSQVTLFRDEQGKKGVRMLYLKSRSEPHRMNMHDDYSKISQFALDEKKNKTLEKWLKAKIPACYIMVDTETLADCPQLQQYAADKKLY